MNTCEGIPGSLPDTTLVGGMTPLLRALVSHRIIKGFQIGRALPSYALYGSSKMYYKCSPEYPGNIRSLSRQNSVEALGVLHGGVPAYDVVRRIIVGDERCDKIKTVIIVITSFQLAQC